MKKSLSFLLSAVMLLLLTIKGFAAGNPETALPSAKAYILVEPRTGKVLYSENPDTKLPMASLTKMMVLLIIAEETEAKRFDFNAEIPASANASDAGGSVIWLEPGEVMTARDLIKSVVISSSNDACIALCEYLAGSEEEFVGRMNRRAAALGLKDTNFKNCVGWDDPEHYSTARDIAKLAGELFKYDYYGEYMLTRLSSVRTGTERETQLLNTNRLANWYDGIIGGKTGTTDGAGYCLAACAERGGMRLISVTLGARNEDGREELCSYLLDRGFAEWQMFTPNISPEALAPVRVEWGLQKTVPVVMENSPTCVIPRGMGGKVEYTCTLPDSVQAPVQIGQAVGEVTVELSGETLCVSGIVAADSVEELNFWKSFEIMLYSLLNSGV